MLILVMMDNERVRMTGDRVNMDGDRHVMDLFTQSGAEVGVHRDMIELYKVVLHEDVEVNQYTVWG